MFAVQHCFVNENRGRHEPLRICSLLTVIELNKGQKFLASYAQLDQDLWPIVDFFINIIFSSRIN